MKPRQRSARRSTYRRLGSWLVLGLTVLWWTTADADATIPRTARMYYQKAGASRCPEVEAIQQAVAQRLGYDPFAEDAPITILVAISVEPDDTLRARISVIDSRGEEHGQRELATPSLACDELATTVALIVSVTIRMTLEREEAEARRRARDAALDAAVRSAWVPLTSVAVDDRPVTVEPPAGRRQWRVMLGATTSAGAVPGVARGATLGIGWRRRSLALALALGADLGSSTRVANGHVDATRYRAVLAGCRLTGALEGCLLAAGGAIHARGAGFPVDATTAIPYAAVGIRGALAHRLPRDFQVELYAELETPIVGASLEVSSPAGWRWLTPAIVATLGLEVSMGIP